jgi:hypothetical protein
VIAFLIIISHAFSQVKNVEGVYYPRDFKINTNQNLHKLKKTAYDTLAYKSFTKSKEDFNLINGCGNYGSDQSNINMACDDNGSYLCTWLDDRSGMREIDAQLFDANDEIVGSMIKVSEQYNSWNSQPKIVYNKVSREYIIMWAESGFDIRFQRIDVTGIKIGNNQSFNQFYYINSNSPSGTVDKNGNLIVTWVSEINYSEPSQVFYRLFDKGLNPLIDQTQLSHAPYENVSSIGWYTEVAGDTCGNFVAVWSSAYNNYSRIILQQINSAGELVNKPVVVNDTIDKDNNYFPTLTSTDDGHYLVAWGAGNKVIAKIFKADSGLITKQMIFGDAYNSDYSYGLCSDRNDKFYFTYVGSIPYGTVISKFGNLIKAPQKIELSGQSNFSIYPNLSTTVNGSMYCVFDVFNKNDEDVMLEKIDTNFNVIKNAIKLGNDYCSSFQTNPAIKCNQNGKSLAVWIDRRDGTNNLYGQILDEEGNPASNNFLINDTSTINWVHNPYILSGIDGNFIICYSGGYYSGQNIVIQKISSEGVKINGPVKISINQYYNYSYSAQTDSSGNMLICWFNNSYLSPCFLQKYDRNLNPLGSTVSFISKNIIPAKRIFSLSINKKFNILAMWSELDTLTGNPINSIQSMVFNDEGLPISDTARIYKVNGNNIYPGLCNIDDMNNMLFMWGSSNNYEEGVKLNIQRRYFVNKKEYDYTNSYSIDFNNTQMQIINFENNKAFVAWSSYSYINSIFLDDNIHSYTPVRLLTFQTYFNTADDYYSYSADIHNDKLLLCYGNNIDPDKGFDIWANVQQINLFDFQVNPYSIYNPNQIENISAPYPNPVGSGVNIQYKINRVIDVKISIYNILGQQIAVLQDGVKEPGIYSASFNTKGLASGIYFITYRGLKSYVQKFVVVK